MTTFSKTAARLGLRNTTQMLVGLQKEVRLPRNGCNALPLYGVHWPPLMPAGFWRLWFHVSPCLLGPAVSNLLGLAYRPPR